MKHGLSDEDVHEIENYLTNELKYIDEMLHHSDWLCGETYTLADISWTAAIYRLEQLSKLNVLHAEKLHYLLDWYDKVKSMDNFCGYKF